MIAIAEAATQALYLFAPLIVSAAIAAVVLRFDLFARLRRPIQVDLLVGAWPAIAYWVRPSPLLLLVSALLTLTLHPTFTLIGYLVGARKSAR